MRPFRFLFLRVLLVGTIGGGAIGLAACENTPNGSPERGTFIMVLDGSVQDTVRGTAYVRDTDTNEPGIELDADSIGWSVHWMPDTTASEYVIMPHALLQDAIAAANDDRYRPPTREEEVGASVFMEYGRLGSFEATEGTLTTEKAPDADHIGHIQAILEDGAGTEEMTVEGHWHAVPAPETLPSHMQP